jgi:hypothetical protein
VSSARHFYDNADEHYGWAETAKTERERAVFLQMAAAWLEVAEKWEITTRNADARPRDGARFSSGAHTVESLPAPGDQGAKKVT